MLEYTKGTTRKGAVGNSRPPSITESIDMVRKIPRTEQSKSAGPIHHLGGKHPKNGPTKMPPGKHSKKKKKLAKKLPHSNSFLPNHRQLQPRGLEPGLEPGGQLPVWQREQPVPLLRGVGKRERQGQVLFGLLLTLPPPLSVFCSSVPCFFSLYITLTCNECPLF